MYIFDRYGSIIIIFKVAMYAEDLIVFKLICIVSYLIVLYHILSYRIVLCRIVSNCIVLYRIVSCEARVTVWSIRDTVMKERIHDETGF